MTTYTQPCGQTLRQTAIQNGIKLATFYARIRNGWPPEKAATTPTRPYFYEWNAPCKSS